MATKKYEQAKLHLEIAHVIAPLSVEVISNLQHSLRMLDISASTPRRVHFVTFADDLSRCELKRLLRSALKFDIDVEVLGADMQAGQWRNGLKVS